MDIFKKPYFNTVKESRFAYTREQLSQRPIFPTLVMDGGAYFFTRQELGIRDGEEMLNKIMDGSLFDYYKKDGVFGWKTVLERFRTTDTPQEWEAHIWLARMYILLPLAQKYMLTGDRRYSDAWYKILSDWQKNNPPYRFDPSIHRFDTDMVWSDMQTTWRMINLIFSAFMLSFEPDCLTAAQWNELHALIKLHAELLYDEAVYHAQKHDAQNHNLQIGNAMIMVGVMYPELENAEKYVEIGRNVVKDNLELSIYPDGVNNEDALSYCPFIARLYLEAQLLLTKNGYSGIEGLDASLQKQYEFLYQFSISDGTTPQIGDSYRCNVIRDIEFVKQLYPLSFDETKKSIIFPQGRMAVLRNERFELFIDAMDMQSWHQHYGRMNFILFCDGEQIICDSGCTNYDRADLREYLNSAQAHNTLSLDDGTTPHEDLSIIDFSLDGEVQYISMIAQTPQYCHRRVFTLYRDRLEIDDTVTFAKGLSMTANLHLPCRITGYPTPSAANQPISGDRRVYTQRVRDSLIRVRTDTPFESEFVPCVDAEARNTVCVALRIPAESDKTHKTVITKV